MKNLHPLHLEDLKRSGLIDDSIRAAGIKSVPPDEIERKLGFDVPGLASAYGIPYDETFSRFRCFYEQGQNSRQKYSQRKGIGNRLYIPDRARAVLNDPSVPLYIIEGEKKALKASQEGLVCIAISGLWNWSNGNKELIPDFDKITLKGRDVHILPDNDYLHPNKHGYGKNLAQAVHELAQKLKERGSRVFIIELPEGDAKGLDDYLCVHTVEVFRALPTIEVKSLDERIKDATAGDIEGLVKEITGIESNTKRAAYASALAKKLKISKKDILRDINEHCGDDTSENREPVFSASFAELVDIVTDENGEVVYLVKENDILLVLHEWAVNETVYVPPAKENLPFQLSRATDVLKWHTSDNNAQLFRDVLTYLKRFSYLPDEQWLIVACFVFLSYVQDHEEIHYLPELLFYAVPERGKSRTGKAVICIAYRGVHTVELREANLFRFSNDLSATIFFDVMDLWKKAERNGCEDIMLGRYEKGQTVARVIFPEKGAFKDTRYYKVYGPTLIATNESLHKILDTRCIPITMPNKPGRYENPTRAKAQEIKERLTAWRARMIDVPMPIIEPVQGLNGRLWDITEPLLRVCKLVYPEGLGDMKRALLDVARSRIEDKAQDIEGKIVTIIDVLSPKGLDTWELWTSDVLDKLNEDRPEGHKYTAQKLGKKLKAMGLRSRITGGHSRIMLESHEFRTLQAQYKIPEHAISEGHSLISLH